jgi:transcriptional regulator with XRE-family HTH domain
MYNRLLKRARELRGLSQDDLASLIGTTASTISDWERHQHQPSPYFREKLCSILEKSPIELGLLSTEELAGGTSSYDPLIPLPTASLIGRDETVAQLRQRLQSNRTTCAVLHGLPGIGKTALAATLARDQKLRRHFDGVLWAGLGPNPDIPVLLSRWGCLLGAHGKIETKASWMESLRSALVDRSFLLIIDDAWKVEDVLSFQIGGPHCVYLITTRFPSLAATLTINDMIRIEELNKREGLALVRQLAPQITRREEPKVERLVEAVGGLPLALTLIGNYLRKKSYSGPARRMTEALEYLSHADARLQLSEALAPTDRHPSLTGNILSLHSLIAIAEVVISEEGRHTLRTLATAFPANTFSEEEAVARTGCSIDTLDALLDAGLLDWRSEDCYTIHQTIADYARNS